METTNNSKIDVYALVTNRIIDQLEAGVIPWQQPWTEAGLPQNLITKKTYNGINLLLLASMGFSRNFFLSFKQVKELGGSVNKGEKSIPVVYWKFTKKEDPITKEEKKLSFIRYYTVFNVDQCTGIPESKIPMVNSNQELNRMEKLEAIINDMPNPPRIQHKEMKAYYSPSGDYINMPKMNTFKDAEGYYGTLFHELIHSTGHTSRLNRKEVMEDAAFGSEPYSMEELTAEIGACYLKSYSGIDIEHFNNNVAYIQNWLRVLKGDKRFIVFTAAKAQRASDYILNVAPESKELITTAT